MFNYYSKYKLREKEEHTEGPGANTWQPQDLACLWTPGLRLTSRALANIQCSFLFFSRLGALLLLVSQLLILHTTYSWMHMTKYFWFYPLPEQVRFHFLHPCAGVRACKSFWPMNWGQTQQHGSILGRFNNQCKTLHSSLCFLALLPATFEKATGHSPGYPNDCAEHIFLPSWDEYATWARNKTLLFQATESWGLLITVVAITVVWLLSWLVRIRFMLLLMHSRLWLQLGLWCSWELLHLYFWWASGSQTTIRGSWVLGPRTVTAHYMWLIRFRLSTSKYY